MKRINSKLKKLLPAIQKNISLKNYTTFKIGGPAKYFFVATIKKDLVRAIRLAKKFNLPFFILGGGSNLLVSDKGFSGMVIKFQMSNVKPMGSPKFAKQIWGNIQMSKLYTEAGAPLSLLVNQSIKQNLSGLEWAVGIPGTVGGAIYGNAGAFKKNISAAIKKAEILDVRNLKIKKFKKQDCKFNYRDSIFKHKKNLIILSAELQLKKGNKKEVQKKLKECLDYRKQTQPLEFPSAGSIFKNPSPTQILKKFRRAKNFSAGELIEKCGLKGKRTGGAKISEKHANFIVNLGGAKAKDVKKLINLAKKKVKKKFGITLAEEIQHLGF